MIRVGGAERSSVESAIRALENEEGRLEILGRRYGLDESFAATALCIHAARCRAYFHVEDNPDGVMRLLVVAGQLAEVEATLAAGQIDAETVDLEEPVSSFVTHLHKHELEFPHLFAEVQRRRNIGDGAHRQEIN